MYQFTSPTHTPKQLTHEIKQRREQTNKQTHTHTQVQRVHHEVYTHLIQTALRYASTHAETSPMPAN
jgi:hypothetical protein